ncbi:metallophosphoesterase family protein [Myxococcota bacterium]
MRFLCLSDIHGHFAALSAALEFGAILGFDQLVVCGDLCFPGPEPLRVWTTISSHKALCVQGVADRAVASLNPNRLAESSGVEHPRVQRLRQARAELGDLILARLAKLPTMARLPVESGDTMLVVHGSPADPTEPFTHDMSDDEVDALLGEDSADLVVCGGSHVPFDRVVSQVRVINVGSVGEAPGGEVAHLTVVETTPFGVTITQHEAPLDSVGQERRLS